MQLLFLQQWLSDEVMKAIGWTLVHSLWQGLLAAVVAGIVIIATKRSVARLRYNLLGAVLILFVITTVITFTQELKAVTPVANVSTTQDIQLTETSFSTITYQTTSQDEQTTLEKFVTYFNTNADLFVLIWAIFFFIHCMKLIGGLAGVQRMKNYKTHASPGEWMQKVDQLSRAIGIKKAVILLQSGIVKVPVAIGFFKPVILVPFGLLSNLPPEQVETILLHELAHIRRNDYLVNILQRFVEAVFFFNPALLWISSLARQEREACCDDIVVANTDSKGNYLEALVAFQEYSMATSGYAMAISGKRNYLLNRVRRMITRENKKLNSMEKVILIIGLIVISAFTFIPKKEIDKKKEPVAAAPTILEKKEPKPAKVTAVLKPAQVPVKHSPARTDNKKDIVVIATGQPVDTVPPAKQKEKEKEKLNDKEQEKEKDKYKSKDQTKEMGDDNKRTFQSFSTTINDDGKTKTETTVVTGQDGKKYSFTKVNNKLTSLSVDGKTIPESEYGNYSELLSKMERAKEENKNRKLMNLDGKRGLFGRRNPDSKDGLFGRKNPDAKDRTMEKKLLRDYQAAQRKYMSEQDKQLRLMEKSRKTTESRRLQAQRLLEKLKDRKSNGTKLNGREIIKNDNHVDNSISTNINSNIHVATTKIAAMPQQVVNDKTSDLGPKFAVNVDLDKTMLKQFKYQAILNVGKPEPKENVSPVKPKTRTSVNRTAERRASNNLVSKPEPPLAKTVKI